MTAARLVLWRHGQTDWNFHERFQGQADVPLNDVGVAQASAAAAFLAGLEPVALWSSDLQRTQQTAAALADAAGLEVRLDPRLREIHVGTWEGKRGDEIAAVEPEAYAKLRRGEDVRRSATGETVAEVGERVASALVDIIGSVGDDDTVVVTTHGLAGRSGLCRLLGLPFDHWRMLGSLDNCGWSVLHRHRAGGYWRLAEHNVTAQPPRTIS